MKQGRPRFESVPIYPALFFVAWIVTVYANSTAPLQALGRPLFVGLVIVIAFQIVVTAIARNRYVGAALVMVLFTTLVGVLVVALISCVVLIGLTVWRIGNRRDVAGLPWAPFARLLNVVATLTLVLVLISAGQAGSLTPVGARSTERGVADKSLPDIYLILLDAYPRSDTLAVDFSFDNGPFLDRMASMGFDVARESHSNYNITWLTLASLFNMAQVPDMPAVMESPSALAEFRALTSATNQGRGLNALEKAGYEIVSIPSGFSSVSLYDADRVLDGGQLTDFEGEVLQQGALPWLLPDVQRQWLLGQHRERTLSTFDRLAEVAAERVDHPRFVFAHVLSPHAPIAFGPNGEPRDGWPCFPTACGMWYGGQIYEQKVMEPIRDQVRFINQKVEKTADQIVARSARDPVVVFFSDHGNRFDLNDPDEMLRSFLMARTPDHPRLFPHDATPVNILPRILNAYAATDLPLATEESFWVDQRMLDFMGPPLTLTPWVFDEE